MDPRFPEQLPMEVQYSPHHLSALRGDPTWDIDLGQRGTGTELEGSRGERKGGSGRWVVRGLHMPLSSLIPVPRGPSTLALFPHMQHRGHAHHLHGQALIAYAGINCKVDPRLRGAPRPILY